MLIIYQSSVKNVRELKTQSKNLKKLINKAIISSDNQSIELLTKLFALLYSAFAETCFLKMIHTPYGFSDDYIYQITSQRNLEQQWNKCLELAFAAINNIANKGEIQNKKQTLERYIKLYIIDPSQIRNKIAHGQWSIALNSENTDKNDITTQKIASLDYVNIDILFQIYEKIGQTVEDLIESPSKAHFNFFYNHMAELETLIEKTKSWSLESKIEVLKEKKRRFEEIKKMGK
ncbi:MAG: hypothetical protein PHP99_02080 [Paludibacter sp.]|nr:hypothetical protein [Paludibacter sp.]